MQIPFFLADSPNVLEKLPLPDGEVLLFQDFINAAEASSMFKKLKQATPWQQDTLSFGGKKVLIPRLQAWYGEKNSRYGYSGLALSPLPWTPLLGDLKSRIEKLADTGFNSVLVNYYRDGKDSVAWHSDDEKELGKAPVIASLSLGETRRFELRHRHKKGQKFACELSHGSLLIRGSGIQQHWQHQVPKQAGVTRGRINLTFRQVMPE
jgi:alkylated DNA repair dioxygenase AlkB